MDDAMVRTMLTGTTPSNIDSTIERDLDAGRSFCWVTVLPDGFDFRLTWQFIEPRGPDAQPPLVQLAGAAPDV